MKRNVINLHRTWRRLKRQARRSRWLFGLFVLMVAAVLIVGLPVILPLVAMLHALDRRRRRLTADAFACMQCGAILGAAALARADAEWAEHVARLCREHPGCRLRLVRDLDAVCIRCGAEYRHDEKNRTFCLR